MLVAVTVKLPVVFPAVYIPPAEIAPPVADQVTPLLDVPVITTENGCTVPACTDAEGGLTDTVTVAAPEAPPGFDAGAPAIPEQLARPIAASTTHSTPPVTRQVELLAWRKFAPFEERMSTGEFMAVDSSRKG
jgi:hypothetical protein